MKTRIYSGVVMIALLLAVLFSNNFWVFFVVAGLAAVQSSYEYIRHLVFLTPNSPGWVDPAKLKSKWEGDLFNQGWGKIFISALIILSSLVPLLGILLVYLNLPTGSLEADFSQAKIANELPELERYLIMHVQKYLVMYLGSANSALFYVMWVWALFIAIYFKYDLFIIKIRTIVVGVFVSIMNVGFFYAIFLVRYFSVDDGQATLNFIQGPSLFLYIIILVAGADSGAYFVGKSIGKHKLAPKVSPNKTIEGFVGGLVIACLLALAYGYFVLGADKLTWSFILISLVAVIGSVHGDLVESFLKRRTGVKDSSSLIPGHGGILDRIDSIQVAFTIFAFYYILG